MQKSEIVLSITPRIIRSAFRPDLGMSEFESGTEANLRSRGLEGGAPPAAATGGPASPTPPPVTAPAAVPPPAMPPPTTPVSGSDDAKPPAADPSAAAGAPAEPAATAWPSGTSALSWRGTTQATVGGTLSVELWATSAQALSVVPLAVRYDPRVLSVVSVEQGNFMSNAGTASSLSKRAEAGSGMVRAVVTAAGGAGAPASGSLIRIVFKALGATDGTAVALVEDVRATSASGEAVGLVPPGEWMVRVR